MATTALISIDRAYKWPTVLTEPPLIVIEVLSPDDSYSGTEKLANSGTEKLAKDY